MDMQAQTLNQLPAKTVCKSCYRCGSIVKTSSPHCPACGKILETVSRIRMTGAMQIILGGSLLTFISYLAFWRLNADSNNHFHGGARDVLLIVFIFALIASIGLGALIAGVWQIVFGKRNKILMLGMIILGIVFTAAGFGIFLSK